MLGFLDKIIEGDCLEVMRNFPNTSIDLVLTDPPYGISLQAQRKTSKFHGIRIANDDHLDWLPSWSGELYRVAKNVAYIFCGWSHVGEFQKHLTAAGFKIQNVLVWHKDWLGLGRNFRPNYELIILAAKSKFATKSRNLSNVLTVRRLSPGKLIHIAEKPVKLLEILVRESTNVGDIVLDTFCGSGATCVAAQQLRRRFVGIELDPCYCALSRRRISPQR
jgi:site-specific DNA-methyltransferase (adenine-specific)